jgi:general secretion pathway protein L
MRRLLAHVYQIVCRFLAWWAAELVACAPAPLRAALSRKPSLLVVQIARQGARFRHGRGRNWRDLGQVRIPASGPGGARGAVDALLRGSKTARSLVVLLLPKSLVLRRAVQLPLAATENLREVLAFEMDRNTPFKAEQVYFDYRAVNLDGNAKRLDVDLLAAPRRVVDDAVRTLAEWDLRADRVAIVDRDGEGGIAFDLLPAAPADNGDVGLIWLSRGLALAAAVLLAVAVYLPMGEQKRALNELEDDLVRARTVAAEADALKKRLTQMAERNRFLIGRKLERVTMTELLHEVTRLLPDNTWLTRTRLQGDKLSLSGYSVTASALIGFLENSNRLAEVRFSSPVTLDARVGLERFDVTAAVLPRQGG